MTVAFLNGKFFGDQCEQGLSAAMISALDAGVQHGVGLFETMQGGAEVRGVEGERSHGEVREAWVLQLDEHMERLSRSARVLGLSDQLRIGALSEVVLETVKRSGLARARVRLTLTGGNLAMLATARQGAGGGGGAGAVDPTVLVVAQPATEYPLAMFERGVGMTLADTRTNPLNGFEGHKTLNYWWRLRELQIAAGKGAGESLVLSVTNHVVGGCVSNVLVVKGERVVTPLASGEEGGGEAGAGEGIEVDQVAGHAVTAGASAGLNAGLNAGLGAGRGRGMYLPSPVLAGVTRGWALRECERLGFEVDKRMVSVQDVLDADEVMLTNSSWGVLPVVRLEKSAIASGTPGRLTLDLRDAWLGLFPSADGVEGGE